MKLLLSLILIFSLSCSNSSEEKTESCDDILTQDAMYSFLKPNGIEIQNDYCKKLYYVLVDSTTINYDDFKIGEKITDYLKADEFRIISHNNWVPGNERYLFWWSEDYQDESDLFISQIHPEDK